VTLERRLFRDEVHTTLRREIVTGVLPAGAVLRDGDLAARFGTSKEPIRSALQRLRAEGLVDTRPQSGTRVALLDEAAALDALELVRTLSIRAAELALPRLADSHLEAMTDANDRFEAAASAGDLDAALTADDDFHDVLLALAGNTALVRVVHQQSDVLRRLELAQFGLDGGTSSGARHRRFVAACAARDLPLVRDLTAQVWSSLADHLSKGTA
jgi:DNA-binding GntR family transcriptional regulator